MGVVSVAAGGSYVSPIGFARAYMGMGDMERCFQWLERALTEVDPVVSENSIALQRNHLPHL